MARGNQETTYLPAAMTHYLDLAIGDIDGTVRVTFTSHANFFERRGYDSQK